MAWWLIVAVHVAVIGLGILFVPIVGVPGSPPIGNPAVLLLLGLAILTLQLRHSFAIARGERPRYALLTMLGLAILVYLPIVWLGWDWYGMQTCVMASAPMVLRRRAAAVVVVTPVIGTVVAQLVSFAGQLPVDALTYEISYAIVALALPAAALFGSARLARLLDELRENRAELAALAIARERLRVSRDLHDLLGQSLSAVSLKGDLAIRLLRTDPPAARAEIESLTGLARDASRGIRAVSRDELAVSLRTETEGAAALLLAAGIRADIDVELPGLAPTVERTLAWGVREGVANALRHSHAHFCAISAGFREENVFLEIVNDGALTLTAEGSGLAGLAERAHAMSGSSTWHVDGDRFRLLIEVPRQAT